MKDKSPLVSVIVPNYNYAAFLDMRITSIFRQTFTDYELILLDDASSDNSSAVLERYRNDPRVSQIVVNDKNSESPFQQWMKGIKLARGKWIWIAEADDICEPDFLETCMECISRHDNVSLCNVGSLCIDAKGKPILFDINQWAGRELRANDACFDGKKYVEHNFFWKNTVVNASGVVFNREKALTLDGRRWMEMRNCGDWMFWMEMAMLGNVIEIYKILNYFRQHNSQTAKGNRNGRGLIESFEIIHAIEELFPKISWSKRHQCYGKFSRYMRRMLKDKDLFREVKVHYTKNFGTSTVFIHYLYYKLCRHFRFLPWVLTEEKDRL